jgi:putative transposase
MCEFFSDRFEEEAGMPKKRYRPEEIISKLHETVDPISQGKMVVEVIKALGVTDVTLYRWRQEYSGLSVPQAKAARNSRENGTIET